MIGAEVQRAVYLALVGAQVADGRIYDRPPEEPKFPYITIGDDQVIDDGNTCGAGWEIYADIHIWSRPREGSKAEAKELGKRVCVAILAIEKIEGQDLISVSVDTSRTERDADGKTEHSLITFRFLTQEE